jgi:hypothetical protein
MIEFFNGINVTLCAVAGVMFLKFWRRTDDRLFLLFAIAFWILAADWTVLAALPHFVRNPSEHNALVYSVRLLAFVLILAGIITKNRYGRRQRTP